MTRKTVAVADIVTAANTFLAAPDTFSHPDVSDPKAQRYGVCGLLEHVLHATGNYRGFSYLSTELAAPGQLRDGYDDTRRNYTMPRGV